MSHQGPSAIFRQLPAERRHAMRQDLEAMVALPENRRSHRAAIIGGAAAFIVLGTGAGAGELLTDLPGRFQQRVERLRGAVAGRYHRTELWTKRQRKYFHKSSGAQTNSLQDGRWYRSRFSW